MKLTELKNESLFASIGAKMRKKVFNDTFVSGRRGYLYEFDFANGFTASVSKFLAVLPPQFANNPYAQTGTHGATKNLWELALLKGGKFCYDYEVTGFDVVGQLTDDEVLEKCKEIASLPSAES